jgi:hypothetical protein
MQAFADPIMTIMAQLASIGAAGFRGPHSFGFYAYGAEKKDMVVSTQFLDIVTTYRRAHNIVLPQARLPPAQVAEAILCSFIAAAFDLYSQGDPALC